MPARTRFLSLGAGVQSSAMLLMYAAGELPGPPPEGALFADTQWEPANVYEQLAYLESVSTIPVIRITAGSIRTQMLDHAAGRGRFASPPLYVFTSDGGPGRLRRQCTREFKIDPMRRWLRDQGYGPKKPVSQLLGITIDEVERANASRIKSAANDWPLIDAGLTRADCLAWLARNGHPEPPKSACIGCPFRSDYGWASLTPAERHDAEQVDAAIRTLPRLRSQVFLHRQRVPLTELDLRSPEERGQMSLLDGECGGWCAS